MSRRKQKGHKRLNTEGRKKERPDRRRKINHVKRKKSSGIPLASTLVWQYPVQTPQVCCVTCHLCRGIYAGCGAELGLRMWRQALVPAAGVLLRPLMQNGGPTRLLLCWVSVCCSKIAEHLIYQLLAQILPAASDFPTPLVQPVHCAPHQGLPSAGPACPGCLCRVFWKTEI